MDIHTRDRRQDERADVSVCAWVSFAGDWAAYSTLTLDLGQGGAQLSALRRVEPGAEVFVHIELPGQTVSCKAAVCWRTATNTGAHVFGVRFMDLSEKQRDALHRFLHEMPRVSATVLV